MTHKNPLYILTDYDVEKIDGLVSMLNLAITEIIQQRAVKDEYDEGSEVSTQETFNGECYSVIAPKPKKSSPD